MEIEGVIIKVLPERTGTSQATGQPWRMAEYVIQTEEQYQKRMCFTVSDGGGGRIQRLNIQEGKRYRVYFDIDAQEYQGRWFNRIQAYDARPTE